MPVPPMAYPSRHRAGFVSGDPQAVVKGSVAGTLVVCQIPTYQALEAACRYLDLPCAKNHSHALTAPQTPQKPHAEVSVLLFAVKAGAHSRLSRFAVPNSARSSPQSPGAAGPSLNAVAGHLATAFPISQVPTHPWAHSHKHLCVHGYVDSNFHLCPTTPGCAFP